MGLTDSRELLPGVLSLRLTAAQVSGLRERFELISDSFGLERPEVQLLYKAKPAQLDLIFRLFDPGDRGKIDAYEFIAGMIIIADASLEQKGKILFKLYDFDYSMNISFDELIILMRTSMNALCYMTGSRPKSIQELEAHTNQIFNKIDTNQDGTISESEFMTFIGKNTEVSQLLKNLNLTTAEDQRVNWGTEDEPEVDSDFENETNRREFNRTIVQERVKSGVETLDDSPFLLEQVGQGDQFMAVKPWEGVVRHSQPSDYKPKRGEDDPPDANLELLYVHGYRCHDVRNNLRYSASGEVVYHTAAVGITTNPETNVQKHFICHTDDIISFDISPRGDMAVTGEIGRTPLLCVWNTDTMECIKSYKGILKRGIKYVSFSHDGTKVAALGADEESCVVVYDVGNQGGRGAMQGVVASGKAGRDTFLCIKFAPNSNDKIYACGQKVFAALTVSGGSIQVKKGIGWNKTRNTQQQALTSIGFAGNNIMTGAYNGCIIQWAETSLSSATKIHEGPISCIGQRTMGEGIVTGGMDGFVYVLDAALNKQQTIDLSTLNSMLPKPRSACEGPGGKILIGTRGGEIYEVQGQNNKSIIKGHFDNELWGLFAHPTKPEIITVGQDSMLAIWDLQTKKQKTAIKIEGPSVTVTISPDGSLIVVGCFSGKLLVLDGSSLAMRLQKHDRNAEISQVRFSPDGTLLAASGHDSEIFVYSVSDHFNLLKKLRGHTSTVTHLDFSVQGDVLQSVSKSYDILYHDINTGRKNPSGASAYKDEKWASWTCILGWPVQGIWPPCSDGSDINALERSQSGKTLATVDDFGQVKLFKYPCAKKNAGFNSFKGHSSHVTNCRFKGNNLITIGGNDKAIFQWRYTEEDIEQEVEEQTIEAVTENVGFFEVQTAQADEFMAVKPWLGEVAASAPNNYTPPRNQSKPPEETMSLLKVHGYRSFDCRNNLRYTSSGKIVYPAASLGVVMDPVSKEQRFSMLQDDDVVALAVHPNRQIVATGQMAHVGKSRQLEIHVWNCETLEPIVCLSGFHRRAVRQLGFSPDGKFLLSTGEDDDHSLAVYEWETKRMVCNSKVDKGIVLGANFLTQSELAVYGAKFIKFFTVSGANCTGSRGIMGRNQPFEAQICGVVFENNFVTGTHAGNLFVWGGRSLSKSIKAHNGQVQAINTTPDARLLTGGSDGSIVLWDSGFNQIQNISIVDYSLQPGIRSLDISPQQTVLVGTRGSEILEIKNWRDIESLMTGHFDGELWGLAIHPFHPLCATCGGDKTIRIWDISQGTMILAIKPLPHDLRAIDWSPDGRFLVAGLVNGVIILLDSNTLATLSTLQSSFRGRDSWIQAIKFSPDGSKVAFGAHGGASRVEVVMIQNSKLVKGYTINAGLTSALTHIDWSVDGSLLVVNSQAYELKFVNVEGKRNVSSSSVKNVEWLSWTCVLGWPVQYIWPEFADGSDINACARSHNSHVIATADDFGNVNLFRFPVVVKKQGSKSYKGHSSHVTNVQFTKDDSYVISTGGNDKCVFVWATDFGNVEEPVHDDEEPQELVDIPVPNQPRRNEELKEKTKVKVEAAVESNNENAFFQMESAGEGDQFMATKPWIGALKPPSSYIKPPRNQDKAPPVNLQLEWVHGYRAKDSRNNLRYLPDGKLIYHAAGLGIIYDKQEHSQLFFNNHADDIIAFDITTDGRLAATGEVGRYPNIFVWDTSSQMVIANFKKPLQRGIGCLAFNPSGTRLAVIAMDDDHSLAIYDLNANGLLLTMKGDRERILSIKFINDTTFVTTGVKHFKLWNISGNQATGRKGQFGPNNNIILCVTTRGNDIIAGASDGAVQHWSGTSIIKSYPIHLRAVDSIWTGDNCIVSGGKDGFVHILDQNFAKKQSFDLSAPQYNSISSFIRSACISQDGSTLLVGTYGSEIFEIDIATGEGNNWMRGHYTPSRGTTVTNEVWGLAVMPGGQLYVSCSDDGTLRVWNIEGKEQVDQVRFTENEEVPDSAKARCIGISYDSTLAAVGFKDGSFKVLNCNNWSIRISKKDRREEISDIKYSPDNQKLAVGSHDNFIDIYTTQDYRRLSSCRGHSSYITHIDWSCDSQKLHSNCGAYELLFWDAESGKQMTGGATALRDEEWATWTIVIGWPVQGIYPPYTDGTDVNAVDRTKKKFGNNEFQLVATSDDFGLLKLYRYPCLTKGAEGVIGRGHSSHVTNVRFSVDDSHVFTAGGDDQCIFQWKIDNSV